MFHKRTFFLLFCISILFQSCVSFSKSDSNADAIMEVELNDSISIAENIRRILKCYVEIAENISISEYDNFRMYPVFWCFKNMIDELDYVEITDALEFKGVT